MTGGREERGGVVTRRQVETMMSCKDITRMIAADELADAGWWRRMTTRLHLLMCRHCQRYEDQIRALGRAARAALTGERARIERSDLAELEKAILKSAAAGRYSSSGPNGKPGDGS